MLMMDGPTLEHPAARTPGSRSDSGMTGQYSRGF